MKTSKIIPILTVAAVFLSVGIIMSSVMSERGEVKSDDTSMADPTDAVPYITDTAQSPPDTVGEQDTSVDTSALTQTEPETELETEPPPVQTIPVGIYSKSGKKCSLLDEYESVWPRSDSDPLWRLDTWTYSDRNNLICDVAYFAVFTSEEQQISFTYWDETWTDRWESQGLDDSYKIGFELGVATRGGDMKLYTVLSPSDTFKAEEYFELYLYDCVAHAHDSWYSHITERTNYDDTKNVMIKITLRNGCYDIDHIILTAFVYQSSDEFDSDGFYAGANKYSIVIRDSVSDNA